LASHHLTKSRYMAGLQCPRRLWLLVNEPLPYEDAAPGSPADVGQDIGRKAHLLFAGGVLVDEEPWAHDAAVARTAALMDDARVPAIFEAAFDYEGIRIRVDVLERLSSGLWGLREVKSSTSLKDHYLDDIALQTYVLLGAGVALASIELLHIDNSYVLGPEGLRWPQFFTRRDVRDLARARLDTLPSNLPAMRNYLSSASLPEAEPGGQCKSPYACEFWDQCTADKPADWIRYLPRLPQARIDTLEALGIDAISAIPADFPLTGKQGIIRDAIANSEPYVAADLARLLAGSGPPACYLDFEAMMPPIPLYEGTRPYQTIPFQWSLHVATSEGDLHHQEFLATGNRDPRRQFAETLIEALAPSDTPIIVYSSYERTRLKELAAGFADLRGPIEAIIARLVDLLPVVRGGVYFPAFQFSNSIKSVGPALCPDFSYDDLADVSDGLAASAAFLQLASGALTDPAEIDRLRAALLAYCKRDTLAMVEVHRALRRLVAA
jgi:hypothetical protein